MGVCELNAAITLSIMNVTWTPCVWRIDAWPKHGADITIETAVQIDGPDLFAVRYAGRCLNKFGEWEMEPMPSSRSEDFLERCRFASIEDAINTASVPIRFARAILPNLPVPAKEKFAHRCQG